MATHPVRLPAVLQNAGRLSALALAMVALLFASADANAQAQISAEALIGDSVTEPDAQRYSDIAEAIKRYNNNDALGAKQFLETAKRKDDRLPPVNLMMAKLYFLSNQAPAGLQALEATARDDSTDPEPYLLLADQAIQQAQAVQASALYDKGIELTEKYDTNPRRKRKFQIRGYAGRAAVLQRWLDWKGAEADLRKWIEADPEESNAYNRLGFVLFMQGREKEGYEAFTKSKELNKDLPSPYVSAASMYQRLANVPENSEKKSEFESKARQSFERAYAEDKTNETTLIAYAEWLIRTGQLEQAATVLEGARAAQADSHEIMLLSGVLAQMTGKNDEAAKFYNNTLALAPGNRDANNQLALLLIGNTSEEDKARAEQIARINQQLNQNNADVNITLAWVLRQRGRGAEANQAFQNGLRLGTLSADSTLIVAKLLAEQNRKDMALQLLENSLKEEQGIFVNRTEAEALIESLK